MQCHNNSVSLEDYFSKVRAHVEQKMSDVLSGLEDRARRLNKAMIYSALQGGKRIRPMLIYAAGDALGVGWHRLDPAAVAVEYIHAYSLIHDDLPAMDDDALRRGQPTCHIAFNEAVAILAGDALQSLAYQVLADKSLLDESSSAQSQANEGLTERQRLKMIAQLSEASGTMGMAAGQALDLSAHGQALTLNQLEVIHQLKTGRLIEAAIEMAVIASDGPYESEKIVGLRAYGRAIGLAFQVQDDILDVISDTQTLGKKVGSDESLDKATFPSILGLTEAREHCLDLHQAAIQALSGFGPEANMLRELSEFTISRVN